MDFVISDVSTVEEDDEPLLQITKVTVLNEKKTYSNRITSREVKPSKYIKLCFVPLCPNSSRSTPEKMFITIPVNPARRKAWLDAVGKTAVGKNPKSPMFCCEDHFNLKKDMKNYEEHLRRGRVQMLLYQTVVPHIFVCNDYGHLKRNERVEVLKKIHAKKEHLISLNNQDDEERQPLVLQQKYTPRQRSIKTVKKSAAEEPIMPGKTVFIEMPAFEYDDQPDYVHVQENGVDTIVIDDSD